MNPLFKFMVISNSALLVLAYSSDWVWVIYGWLCIAIFTMCAGKLELRKRGKWSL